FGTAKEHHGMRYTQMKGKEKMVMKVGLTFACLNMKKLANMLYERERKNGRFSHIFSFRFSFA
ncbi:MAG: IS5/IS1182 family transposase, partial [Emergencia sp.]|nr:IS5/IS1182 family transposase [Emergencia sp.]